ncbi:MAG: hypothetical protein LBC33_02755 [Mycoplasmataceae bacterium]|jgi:hypothetical protein|nr:hypothetical protein [Mycoplasmataceae bacterium]
MGKNQIIKDNQKTGVSGEMFVGAELSRRGWNVALTIKNAKGVDLLIEKDGKSEKVQVKSTYGKTGTWSGIPLSNDADKFEGIYAFVNLNGVDQPVYYFIKSNKMKLYHRPNGKEIRFNELNKISPNNFDIFEE